ncbi:hypothetical protein LTR84_010141 [Exophiala bonariae]|uniref:Chromo domain-containing protein n=1 Tax=Exophiala bonariae TaxID=1690606 RepID=A0AAV9MTQ9_9EURO|nr:hypothetical protein LTR84_010141 [Exophiala bonariae]
MLYLVKWQGYGEEQCTWEPSEHFSNPQTLKEWHERLAIGDTLDEDEVTTLEKRMAVFSEQQDGIERRDEDEQQLVEDEPPRASKRRRLINGQKPHELSSSFSVSSSSSDSDTPLSLRITKASSTSGVRPILGVHGLDASAPETMSVPTTSSTGSITGSAFIQEPRSFKSSSSKLLPKHETHKGKHPENRALPPPSKAQITLKSRLTTSKPQGDGTTTSTAAPKGDAISRRPSLGRLAESRAGERFKNLRHQNNYMKKNRREGIPDVSKMQLMAPEDWNQLPLKPQPPIAPTSTTDSWLFLPDDGNAAVASPISMGGSSDQAMSMDEQNPASPLPKVLEKAPADNPECGHFPNVQGTVANPAVFDKKDVQPEHRSSFSVNPSVTLDKPKKVPQVPSLLQQGNTSNAPSLQTKQKAGFSTDATVMLDKRRILEPSQRQGQGSASNPDLSDPSLEQRNRRVSFSANPTTLLDAGKDLQPTVVNPFQPLLRNLSLSTMSANTGLYGPLEVTPRSGRLFTRGVEVLVHLSLNGYSVGDVKLLRIPHWLIKKLVVLKHPGEKVLRVDFPQLGVRTWADYSDLELAGMKSVIVVGEIQPYEDTAAPLNLLADYLEKESVCALWIYPEPVEPVVMILYPHAAPQWSHLGKGIAPAFHNSRLHLLIRNTTTSLYPRLRPHEQALLRQSSGFITNTGPEYNAEVNRIDADLERTTSRSRRSSMELPSEKISDPHYRGTFSRDEMAGRDATRISSNDKNHDPRRTSTTDPSGSRRSSMNLSLEKITDARFRGTLTRDDTCPQDGAVKTNSGDKKWDPQPLSTADFQFLITASARLKIEPRHARVFVAFDRTHPYEARTVLQWLGEHISSRNIFSATERNGWEEFCEAFEGKVGVALFHDQVPHYTSLPKLSSWLKRDGLACFNVTFDELTGKISFSRIFPRGTVLALTEGCMTGCLEQSLTIVNWFEERSRGKSSSWKLLLFPNAIEHCFHRLTVPGVGSDSKRTLGEVLAIILRLKKGSDRTNPTMDPDDYIIGENLDRQHGIDDSFIVSPNLPSDQSGTTISSDGPALRARDRRFMEFILGWASMNCVQYRRFVAIDDIVRNHAEPHSCHVGMTHPDKFLQAEQLTRK